MNIGEFIKQKRLEKNLTLEQLGKRIGVSKMTVLRWESGEIKNIKSDKIERLANALGIPVIALFEGFDENGNSTSNVEEITPREFYSQTKVLLDSVPESKMSYKEKQKILSDLEFICLKDEK